MKSLIVYCSTHGTTAKAAHLLRKRIEGDIIAINLDKTKLHSDLELFDSVIIGGSIHAGSIQGKIKKFMKEHEDVLRRKNLGLFLCCMRDGQEAYSQFENAFPSYLREAAIAKGLFGGEFIFSKMNFFEKMIAKSVSGSTEEISHLDLGSINEFAETFNTNKKYVPV
ncbi:flavodoxin domain-containing protein [Bacillus sp. ISL-39]|uniref:flavodoxin domain-containing protein n=1 Tax=Bacillus sp. ISL-39 TaxID=2819124 RepID=UPI001BEB8CEB|nr:flavodoxin domain-containing protein [Bacillus sp. ISL-39]MBT2637822.1 flavodoxin domain-containing protein [Bacillus sp. ISL-39]